jgi:hypothetical protein
VPKVFDISLKSLGNHAWIVVEKVKPLRGRQLDATIKRATGLRGLDDLQDVVRYSTGAFGADDADPPARHHKRLYPRNEWYASLVDLVFKCEFNPEELHGDNWGINSVGTLVLLDTGM